MRICPYCGHHNEDDAKVCEKCRAGFPHEEDKNNEEPKRVSKRKNKE